MSDKAPSARQVLAELRALGSEEGRAGMARFGINTAKAFGVSMAAQRPLERKYRRNHALAAELWASGFHEARILAALIEDPKLVTPQQMDAWVADFNSWDLCDQACMKVFARTPYVATKVAKWAKDKREFVRRAAFATIAGYAVAAKKAPDAEFAPFFALIEQYATDERNFVRKAVNWALRQIGKRSPSLHRPALALAETLAASDDKTARWIGKDATRELTDPAQLARIAKRG
ncbi:MAG TPA: DNA alkylation repair protein [Bauldia sp.]|nr:DNA alkylation repair protein [Bauldia sp.]